MKLMEFAASFAIVGAGGSAVIVTLFPRTILFIELGELK